MDFIAWCDKVLRALVGLQNTSPSARQYGVREEQIAQVLYGDTFPSQPGFYEAPQRKGMWNALVALEQVSLIVTGQNGGFIRATPKGWRHLDAPILLWERLCSEHLDSDQAALLRAVNQLCVHEEVDHVWLADIDESTLVNRLSWNAIALVAAVTQELVDQDRLVEWRGPTETSYPVRSTYHGLAWETRRAYTLNSRQIADHIQDLIAIKTRRLRHLEQQQSFKGVNTPPEILMELEDLRQELAELEKN